MQFWLELRGDRLCSFCGLSSISGLDQQHPIIKKIESPYAQIYNSQYFKMSFFEKMMRINQSKSRPAYLDSNEDERDNETDGGLQTGQECPVFEEREQKQEKKVAHSRREEQLPDVPQEPKAQTVYASLKPILITCLLPKKQQLLRDMLARKREFDMKKLTSSNMNKGTQLKQRLEESSLKFVKSTQPQVKNEDKTLESSTPIVQSVASLTQSSIPYMVSQVPLPPTPINAISMPKQNKKSLKESLVLDISNSSIHKQNLSSNNIQRSSSDPFGKQVMIRLLNMLQNERNDRKDMLAMSINLNNQFNHHERQKQGPIIINNILKTPVDALNKDLIEREMKIRMLENNRSKHKKSFNYNPNAAYTEIKSEMPLTQRSEYTKCNEFNGIANPRNTKTKISLECSRISIESKKERQEAPTVCKKQEQSTKPSSSFSSQINDPQEVSKPKKQRERAFNKQKNTKRQEKSNSILNHRQLSEQKKSEDQPCLNNVSEMVAHKASIRLDIPLNDAGNNEGLTLAEAFKRKIGKLKSQKQKQKIKAKPLSSKTDEKQYISDENAVMTEVYREYKTPKDTNFSLSPLQSSQTINFPSKESVNSKKTLKPKKRVIASKELPQNRQNTSSKKSRQPSKDLIDRLIGGERAKISKKQMYALTRKNYQNLPEIQAKRKQQEKKELEQQRLAKIRELQRSTRTLKQVKVQLE